MVLRWWYHHLVRGIVSFTSERQHQVLCCKRSRSSRKQESTTLLPASCFLRTRTVFLVFRWVGTLTQCDWLIRGPLLVVSLVMMFPIDSTTNKRKSKWPAHLEHFGIWSLSDCWRDSISQFSLRESSFTDLYLSDSLAEFLLLPMHEVFNFFFYLFLQEPFQHICHVELKSFRWDKD